MRSISPLFKSDIDLGDVMGPILYLIHTYDLLLAKNVLVGTFADDTAITSFMSS